MKPEILVVGAGPGPISLLTKGAEEALLAADKVFFRMSSHPVYHWLAGQGKLLVSFDRLYTIPRFTYEGIYRFIVEALIKEATIRGRAVYALPGNPWVFETTMRWLKRDAGVRDVALRTLPGMSFLELIYDCLGLDPAVGVLILTPGAVKPLGNGFADHLGLLIGLIGQTVTPSPRCTETNVEALRRWLLARFPADHPVSLVWTEGMPDYETRARTFPLTDLATECGECKFFASLYVPPLEKARETGV